MDTTKKMATNAEINLKIGTSLFPINQCPTKAQVIATEKGRIKGYYRDTQLIKLNDVTKPLKKNLINFNIDYAYVSWFSTESLTSTQRIFLFYEDSFHQEQSDYFELEIGTSQGDLYLTTTITALKRVSLNPLEDEHYSYSYHLGYS